LNFVVEPGWVMAPPLLLIVGYLSPLSHGRFFLFSLSLCLIGSPNMRRRRHSCPRYQWV